jgi:integrase
MANKLKGKGWFVPTKSKYVYVCGSVNGKYYRKSTNQTPTKAYIKWIEKNYQAKLEELCGISQKTERTSVEEFGLEVLHNTSHKRATLNQKDLISKFQRLVLPYFKNYALEDIKSIDIEKWQRELLESYSTSTVSKCRQILGTILHKATGADILHKNPMDYAEGFEVKYEKRKPYTDAEVSDMLRFSKGWLRAFLYIAFTSGLRTGEVIGLKWEDIDLENRVIYLKRSISKGVIKNSSNTKNHDRVIDIPDVTVEILKSYKFHRPNKEWVFVSSHGTFFAETKTIVKYHFKPLLQKLGIEYKTLYVTRHTYSSMLANSGINKAFVKESLGHSAKSTVLDDHYVTHDRNKWKDVALEANNVFTALLNGTK